VRRRRGMVDYGREIVAGQLDPVVVRPGSVADVLMVVEGDQTSVT
jgi:hypothetical protein